MIVRLKNPSRRQERVLAMRSNRHNRRNSIKACIIAFVAMLAGLGGAFLATRIIVAAVLSSHPIWP